MFGIPMVDGHLFRFQMILYSYNYLDQTSVNNSTGYCYLKITPICQSLIWILLTFVQILNCKHDNHGTCHNGFHVYHLKSKKADLVSVGMNLVVPYLYLGLFWQVHVPYQPQKQQKQHKNHPLPQLLLRSLDLWPQACKLVGTVEQTGGYIFSIKGERSTTLHLKKNYEMIKTFKVFFFFVFFKGPFFKGTV